MRDWIDEAAREIMSKLNDHHMAAHAIAVVTTAGHSLVRSIIRKHFEEFQRATFEQAAPQNAQFITQHFRSS